jgi:predicted RNA polymerase sigma factor
VAIARTDGPAAALDRLAVLEADERISDDRRLHAVRAHLLEETGALAAAADAYRVAAARTTSLPRQRYLNAQADRLDVLDGR